MNSQEYTEKALWGLYHFVLFNRKAISDVIDSLDFALNQQKELICMVDFSDIHPIMYPDRSYIYDEDEFAVHGEGVRILWESYFSLESRDSLFKLALTPGARLEVLESLRHCKCRIERKIEQYLPSEVLKGSVDSILDHIAKNKYTEIDIIKELSAIANEHAIEGGIRRPAAKVVELFDKKLLHPLESLLPDKLVNDLLHSELQDRDIRNKIIKFFVENPRRPELNINQTSHDNFHDAIDIYNLSLTYDLNALCATQYRKYFTPFITHTERVIAAGRILGQTNKHSLVQRSIAPLYIATGAQLVGVKALPNFFKIASHTISAIYDELKSIESIDRLKKMPRDERNKYLKYSSRSIRVPGRIMELLRRFCADIYSHVDLDFIAPKENAHDMKLQDSKVTSIKEIITKINAAQKAAKESANTVRKVMSFEFDKGLSSLYAPGDTYAKSIADWLESEDDI